MNPQFIFSVFYVWDECSNVTLYLPVQKGTEACQVYMTPGICIYSTPVLKVIYGKDFIVNFQIFRTYNKLNSDLLLMKVRLNSS